MNIGGDIVIKRGMARQIVYYLKKHGPMLSFEEDEVNDIIKSLQESLR